MWKGQPTGPGAKIYRAPLRATDAWSRLYSELGDERGINWDGVEGRRVRAQTIGIPYSAGGFEGMSYAALSALVSTDCIQRVAALSSQEQTCPKVARINETRETPRRSPHIFMNVSTGEGPLGLSGSWHTLSRKSGEFARCEWASDFEDSALGLCMHLLNVRFMQCTCFTSMPFLPWVPCECTRSRIAQNIANSLHTRCHKSFFNTSIDPQAVELNATDGRLRLLFHNGSSAARLIDHKTCDTAYMNTTRCHTPLALHALKTPMQFLAWWTLLRERGKA